MFAQFISMHAMPRKPVPREGDLYKVLELHGHTFEIRYGYYEPFERENPHADPMPIYPDFLKEPRYTAEGMPFVTMMQDACGSYRGCDEKESGECAECIYYRHGQELIGICTCKQKRA